MPYGEGVVTVCVMDIIVLDMSDLAVEVGSSTACLLTSEGEVVVSADVRSLVGGSVSADDLASAAAPSGGVSEGVACEIAFRMFDAALSYGQVFRSGIDPAGAPFPVGLYDPNTGEVAVGGVPGTRSFAGMSDLTLGPRGTGFSWVGDMLVASDGTVLSEVASTRFRLGRVMADYLG